MIIFVTRAHGQVGWELQRTLAPLGQIIAIGRSDMNLADPDSLRRAICDTKPDLIANAAAYRFGQRACTIRKRHLMCLRQTFCNFAVNRE